MIGHLEVPMDPIWLALALVGVSLAWVLFASVLKGGRAQAAPEPPASEPEPPMRLPAVEAGYVAGEDTLDPRARAARPPRIAAQDDEDDEDHPTVLYTPGDWDRQARHWDRRRS